MRCVSYAAQPRLNVSGSRIAIFPGKVWLSQSRGTNLMDERTSSGLQRATDGELVGAAKCGNEEAFERLFVRYERRVFAVAQRIVKNREDAEDIAQECFKKAFLHLGTFQHKSQFSTWLTRIAM